MLHHIPWLGPYLKHFVEAHIAHTLIAQAGWHATVGFAWIGLIFTITVICAKHHKLGQVLVDLTFLAYISFCVWSIYSAIIDFQTFRHSWTVYFTGASIFSAAWIAGFSFMVLLGVNKIVGYMPVHMLQTFGGGIFGHLHTWLVQRRNKSEFPMISQAVLLEESGPELKRQ